MSNSTIFSFNFASQTTVIYMGFFIFASGVIGNSLNVLVFLSLRTFRESSCGFYLIAMSIANICHLFIGDLTFIMINGFGINWLNRSIFYCKFRPFYVQFCILTSFSCMCLAIIDQFMAICSNPRWHQWNNIKLARYIVIGTIIFWILHGIPFLLYYVHIVSPITGQSNCVIISVAFQKYYNFFYSPVLICIIPMAIMILFGTFAYRNVQNIAYRTVPLVRQESEKQLTTMVLVQVFFDIIPVSPLVALSIFRAIYNTPNDPLILAQLNLISNILIIINYLHFAASFYIYVSVSKRFRQQLIYVLFRIHFDRFRLRRVNNNQIEPQT
ncbi:unnamed protein product [Adineta steineri]|uniref:G-protein coupled receptors family 1 profile domain-containing protein n=1 Tax=Adineta steineri TaxID=433720 RepID=A0A818QG25_9BILA|nr:unnamed protein product [Adineta steineri]CAF1367760.1 unnamed protein product [Adineta steineri]CAF3640173.1 unnamed protein product [Adineta steineri]CAF3698976.1 unnamed protein product [Adineta steineri]CAF4118974.1 unnamed protein product [Adineta steineri]